MSNTPRDPDNNKQPNKTRPDTNDDQKNAQQNAQQNEQKTEENNSDDRQMKENITDRLMEVYDPEFPLIDIYTLWLVYEITIDHDRTQIQLLMTFTTPQCPMGETIKKMVENAMLEVYPWRQTIITITFDPLRSPKMIRDEDLQRMFE